MKIDATYDTGFFGLIIAAFSIGQLLASPLFGYWSQKTNNHKTPLLTCLAISIVANVLYAYLQSITLKSGITPKYWMFLSRFVMGLGACKISFIFLPVQQHIAIMCFQACAALMRSYVSGATSLEERTSVLANISACQGLGFIM
jgi:ceroid-lipofuscinosis MFS transporter 7